MTFTANQIAVLIKGKIEGNPDNTVRSFGRIEEAQNGQLAFLANPKYEEYLYTTNASVIIISDKLELKQPVNCYTHTGSRSLILLLQVYYIITSN